MNSSEAKVFHDDIYFYEGHTYLIFLRLTNGTLEVLATDVVIEELGVQRRLTDQLMLLRQGRRRRRRLLLHLCERRLQQVLGDRADRFRRAMLADDRRLDRLLED